MGFYIPAFYSMAEKTASLTGISLEQLLDEYRSVHKEKGTVEYPFATIHLPSVRKYFRGKTGDEIKDALRPAFTTFNSIRSEQLCLYPGVEETLRFLSEKGVHIIGYTDSGELNGFYRLQMLGISDLFCKIYVSDYEYSLPEHIVRDPRIKKSEKEKPDPDFLCRIVEAEGLERADVIYMGDSLTRDIYMAHEAGIVSIQCRYPVSFDESEYYQKLVRISNWTEEDFRRERDLRALCEKQQIQPDYLIRDYSEIKEIICNCRGVKRGVKRDGSL